VDSHRTLAHQLLDRHSYTMRGCCTAGADVAPTVSAVCEIWDTPGIPSVVAERTHNKYTVRKALDDAGLERYQPRWIHMASAGKDKRIDALRTDAFAREHCNMLGMIYDFSLPIVLKPLSQRASRGISIVRHASEYYAAEGKVTQFGNAWLEEECLTGTEHSAEMILDGAGNVLWFNIVDRIFDYSSGTPIELGHVNPTCLTPEQVIDIVLMMGHVSKALDVTWGPFKADVMMTEDGPKILEVTARLSGGWDCQKTSPLTGRHPMRTLLQLACGMEVERQPKILEVRNVAACAAILPQKTGVVTKIPTRWPQMLQSYPQEILWNVQAGDTIGPAQHNGERAGFVLAQGVTRYAAWIRAKEAADALAEAIEVT
jgi:biotin carboxylase